jgi:hypothetical protein
MFPKANYKNEGVVRIAQTQMVRTSGRPEDRWYPPLVADWLATSRARTGSWNIEAWFVFQAKHMTLHTQTQDRVLAVLAELGYDSREVVGAWPVTTWEVEVTYEGEDETST